MKHEGFTLGPWNVMAGRTLLHIETDISAPVAGLPICSVPVKDAANAHLIAMAPMLLEDNEKLHQALTACAAYFDFQDRVTLARCSGAKVGPQDIRNAAEYRNLAINCIKSLNLGCPACGAKTTTTATADTCRTCAAKLKDGAK